MAIITYSFFLHFESTMNETNESALLCVPLYMQHTWNEVKKRRKRKTTLKRSKEARDIEGSIGYLIHYICENAGETLNKNTWWIWYSVCNVPSLFPVTREDIEDNNKV